MLSDTGNSMLFCEYYAQWVEVYKRGAIREATMAKYLMTQKWVEKLAPKVKVSELTRTKYQQLLNDYAKEHERQTTLDFHHQLKGAILDAVDEGMIERDPTRKAIIKGKTPRAKKIKYLNQFELHTLIADLDIKEEPNWDWFILLVAKTGMRFSEALAITPSDFDFARQTLSISKTWDYKGDGGFLPTKNKSSVRKIQIDWQIVVKFAELTKGLPENKPIFVDETKIYNSTVNDVLARHCKARHFRDFHTWTSAYPCIAIAVCRSINCQCCTKAWTCQYDHNTENVSAYYSGIGEQRCRSGNEDFVRVIKLN